MNAKIINGNPVLKQTDYPILKSHITSSGQIVVLFTSSKQGVVVYSNRLSQPIGDTAGFNSDESWVEDEFTPFNGTIELSNN